MIRYALVCEADHEFDGWFRSSADFEAQVRRKLVACAICGSSEVTRGLMAPSVITARGRVGSPEAAVSVEPTVPAAQPVIAMPDPQQKAAIEALIDLKRRVIAASEDVGDRFAEEARKIHYGEAPERGIYGQATGEEARALIEEGIEVHALPVLPDEHN